MSKSPSNRANKATGTSHPSTKLLPFEFRVFRRMPEWLQGKRVLVACSGGRDSVALAACLVRLAPRLGLEVALAHIHHGASSEPSIRSYRRKARIAAQDLANSLGVSFYSSAAPRGSEELRSEEALRDFRLVRLKALAKRHRFDVLAFAHHADDLLETRLIRLIRGTGPDGLEAMSDFKAEVIRPFLRESVADIDSYARQKKLNWIEDPTNSKTEALRNWIRLTWLPALEEKRPGAKTSLARSLETIASACARSMPRVEQRSSLPDEMHGPVEMQGPAERQDEALTISKPSLNRKEFMAMTPEVRLETLAIFIRSLGLRGVTQAHLAEIEKRIRSANRRKNLVFRVLKVDWHLTPDKISIEK